MASSFQKQRRTILVSGAGIAGLASALFISRAGFRVEVFEQALTLDPIGSGLQLSPNAMHVLAALGLDRRVKTVAIAPSCIDVHNALSGKKITSIPLGTGIVKRYGQPYLVIHRADLQKILLCACQEDPDIHMRMGVMVQDAVSHPNGISVIADSAGGTGNFRGVALIGADGVHSVIRSECFECKSAQSTGTSALRALVRSQDMPIDLQTEKINMWLAPDAHAVVYPVRGEQYHNIVLTVREDFGKPAGDAKITGAKIAAGLMQWHSGFTNLLDINADWTTWPLFGAPNLRKWQEGSIVLVGDAAHAMTPHAAQGAAMGLEDAAVLGWALSHDQSLEQAFYQYQRQRMKRAKAVRRLSEKNRIIYQLPSGLASIRNIAMLVMGGNRIFNRQDWIYRWRPPVQMAK